MYDGTLEARSRESLPPRLARPRPLPSHRRQLHVPPPEQRDGALWFHFDQATVVYALAPRRSPSPPTSPPCTTWKAKSSPSAPASRWNSKASPCTSAADRRRIWNSRTQGRKAEGMPPAPLVEIRDMPPSSSHLGSIQLSPIFWHIQVKLIGEQCNRDFLRFGRWVPKNKLPLKPTGKISPCRPPS